MTNTTPRPARGPRAGNWLMAVVAVALAGCSSGSPKATVAGGSTTAATGAEASRSVSGTATTSAGRYRITLMVGGTGPGGAATVCAPGAVPEKTARSVEVTVTNDAGDRAAPFPALRVELDTGGSPEPVPVRDSSGTCTFTPHDAAMEGGASVIFPGATPPIADQARSGGAGRVLVSISETGFSLAVPVPAIA